MSDQLIDDYLRDLRVSAWIRQLPPPQTAALETEVRERIDGELAAAGNRDEATVYRVLDRMGAAGDIVAKHDSQTTAAHPAIDTLLAPVARLRFTLTEHGWGVAEIGSLLLLIVGPFILWWMGPILGIILVRAGTDRWSARAEHVATVVVFSLLTVQAILAVALLGFVLMTGGSFAVQLQGVVSALAPGHLGSSLGPALDLSGSPLFVVRIVGGLLAPVAGLASGIYLALSPRIRR